MNFLEKNNMLVSALVNNYNADDNLQSIASKLFEVMTGQVLHQETDITNGEDFSYKSTSSCISSNRVHQAVANWFGWSTNNLQSTINNELKLVNIENPKVAEILQERFLEFKKPENAIEKITYKKKVILQSPDIYGIFSKITGEFYEKGTGYYDKKSHFEFLESMGYEKFDLENAKLIFINHLGEEVDYS